MEILRGIEQLKNFMSRIDCREGCLADTGFLYGASYTEDRLYQQALEVFLILEEAKIPIHINVVGRMEFVDLVFRKQLTTGAISVFQSLNAKTADKSLFDFLKKIRDDDSASKKKRQSYKIGEKQLKKLRLKFEESGDPQAWKIFCSTYVGKMLINEWEMLEDELGLHFIEVLSGQTSFLVKQPLYWRDMVQAMGDLGVRSPDAMVINLFNSSALSLLITADKDFEYSKNLEKQPKNKAVFILDENFELIKNELTII